METSTTSVILSRIGVFGKGGSILCRLCLKNCSSAVNIFDPEGTNGLLLWEIIKELLQLDVCEGDGLPKTICEECQEKVKDFKHFKSMCIEKIEFLMKIMASSMVNDAAEMYFSKFPALCPPEPALAAEEMTTNASVNIAEDSSADADGGLGCAQEAENMQDEGSTMDISPAVDPSMEKDGPEVQQQLAVEDEPPSRNLRPRKACCKDEWEMEDNAAKMCISKFPALGPPEPAKDNPEPALAAEEMTANASVNIAEGSSADADSGCAQEVENTQDEGSRMDVSPAVDPSMEKDGSEVQQQLALEDEPPSRNLRPRKACCKDEWEMEGSLDVESIDEDTKCDRVLRKSCSSGQAKIEPQFVEGFSLLRDLLMDCPLCGRLFETRRGLTLHLNQAHHQQISHCSKPRTIGGASFNAKALDPLAAEWGLKECKVVLVDIFPGGVGASESDLLAHGTVRNENGSSVEEVPGEGKESERVDSAEPMEIGDNCDSNPERKESGQSGVVCDWEQSVILRKKSSESTMEGTPPGDKDRQLEDAGVTDRNKDSTGTSVNSNVSELRRFRVKTEPQSNVLRKNPLMGQCIVILDDSEDNQSSPCTSPTFVPPDSSATSPLKVKHDSVIDDGAPYIIPDQSPTLPAQSLKVECQGSEGDYEMDPLFLEESSCGEENDDEEDEGKVDCGVGEGSARTHVWPHLILRQKHQIETLSDSGEEEEGATNAWKDNQSWEDSGDEVIVEAVVNRGERVNISSTAQPSEVCESTGSVRGSSPSIVNVDRSECGTPSILRDILVQQPVPVSVQPVIPSSSHMCNACGVECGDRYELEAHLLSVHAAAQSLACNVCSGTFAPDSRLSQNVGCHCNSERFVCVVCRAEHPTKEQLLWHTKEAHTELMQYQGEVEPEFNSSRGGGMVHVGGANLGYGMDQGSNGCLIPVTVPQGKDGMVPWRQPAPSWDVPNGCEGMPDGLVMMEGGEDAAQQFASDIYAQSVLSDRHDALRMSGHVVQNPHLLPPGAEPLEESLSETFPCTDCPEVLGSKSARRRHMVTKHNVVARRHECPYCGKTFRRADYVKHHVRTHTGESPYKCHLCPKEFKQKKSLKKHEMTHVRTTTTTVTTTTTTSRHVEESGEEGHHSEGHVPQLSEKQNTKPLVQHGGLHVWFACPVCGRAYRNRALLEDHFAEHSDFSLYECRRCRQRFLQYKAMQEHFKTCQIIPE